MEAGQQTSTGPTRLLSASDAVGRRRDPSPANGALTIAHRTLSDSLRATGSWSRQSPEGVVVLTGVGQHVEQ